jgi:hypothetical protein
MSVSLSSKKNGGFHFNNVAWSQILCLAQEYDWEPAGTIEPYWEDEPDAPEWDGNYASNDAQIVTSEDAQNMADALEKAVEDITANLDPDELTGRIEARSPDRIRCLKPDWYLTPHEFWGIGNTGKQRIKDFIKFCRQGEFRIY